MFAGFEQTDFMDALKRWNELGKKAKCYYRQSVVEYDTGEFKSDFKVDGGKILDGIWFTEI